LGAGSWETQVLVKCDEMWGEVQLDVRCSKMRGAAGRGVQVVVGCS
jgi:hypothetical protein